MIHLDNNLRSHATSESCEPVRDCDQYSLDSRNLNHLESNADNTYYENEKFENSEEVQIYTEDFVKNYENVRSIIVNDQIHRLQTIIRNSKSTRSDFILAADRLIRVVIETGLDLLPVTQVDIMTPGNYPHSGSSWTRSSCGVSIIRSGEAMENGLRDCCRSIRIGKILISTDEETQKATVYYSKFPPFINKRIILLMYPILNYATTVLEAVEVLMENEVLPENIILLTLFATPNGVETLSSKYPKMTILTSEISSSIPGHFSTKYFGTS